MPFDKWRELAVHPKYKNLTTGERNVVKKAFFEKKIAPFIDEEELHKTRLQFDDYFAAVDEVIAEPPKTEEREPLQYQAQEVIGQPGLQKRMGEIEPGVPRRPERLEKKEYLPEDFPKQPYEPGAKLELIKTGLKMGLSKTAHGLSNIVMLGKKAVTAEKPPPVDEKKLAPVRTGLQRAEYEAPVKRPEKVEERKPAKTIIDLDEMTKTHGAMLHDSILDGFQKAEENFINVSKYFEPDSAEYKRSQATFLNQVITGLAQAPIAVGEYLATSYLLGPLGPYLALGTINAVDAADQGFGAAAKGMLRGVVMQRLLHWSARRSTAPRRIGAGGVAFGGEAAVLGGGPTEIAAGFITGAILSSHGQRRRQYELELEKLNKIETAEPLSKEYKKVTDMLAKAKDLREGKKITDPEQTALDQFMLETKLRTTLEDTLGKKSVSLKTKLLDRFNPIRVMEDFVKAVKGENISVEESAYWHARLFQGVAGLNKQQIQEVGDIMAPASYMLTELDALFLSRRMIERADKTVYDKKSKKQVPIKNPITKEEATKAIEEIERRVGPENYEVLTKAADGIHEWTRKNFVEMGIQSGVLSKEGAEQMMRENQHYIPLDVADYLYEKSHTLHPGSKSFSVAKQEVFRKTVGTEKDFDSPIHSLMRKIISANQLFHRNAAAMRMGKLIESTPELIPEGIAETSTRIDFIEGKKIVTEGKLYPDKSIPKGYDKIHWLENGVKKETIAPQPVVDAIKGMNAHQIDFLTKWAAASSGLIRAGATTFSIPFMFTNALRDYQTAKLVSTTGMSWGRWAGSFVDNLIHKFSPQENVIEFEKSNAGMGGFYGSVLDANLTIDKAIKSRRQRFKESFKTPKDFMRGVGTVIKTPLELIRTAGEIIEMTPRLAIYKEAKRRGMTKKEAAIAARDGTVDFFKSGDYMRVLNLWIPFLNARTHGTYNIFKAFHERPKEAMLAATTLVGIPVIALEAWNRSKFPNSYKEIRQNDKDNYFNFIYGEEIDKETGILVPKYLKMTKGEAGRLIGNPLQAAINAIAGDEKMGFMRTALTFLSDASPVPFIRDEKISPTAVVSGVTPPFVRTAFELGTERSVWSGRDLIPRRLQQVEPYLQYTDRTTEFAKWMGRQINVSPILLDHALRGFSGGLFNTIVEPTEVGHGVFRRFHGVGGGTYQTLLYRKIDELMRKYKTKNYIENTEAEQFAAILLDKDRSARERNEARRIIAKRGKKFAKKVLDSSREIKAGITVIDRSMSRLPNKVKAPLILEQVKKIEALPDRFIFIDGLYKKKIDGKRVISFDVARVLWKRAWKDWAKKNEKAAKEYMKKKKEMKK